MGKPELIYLSLVPYHLSLFESLFHDSRNSNDKRIRRNIFRDYRTRTGHRTASDFDGSNKHSVRADPYIVLDNCFVLALAVEITGDCTGPDICVFTYHCISEISEMHGLGPAAQPRLLDFDKVSHRRVFFESCVHAQMREWTYGTVCQDVRVDYHAMILDHDVAAYP